MISSEEFTGDDFDALEWLKSRGYTVTRGGVIHPPQNHTTSLKDNGAIEYLCWEWDYDYDPN